MFGDSFLFLFGRFVCGKLFGLGHRFGLVDRDVGSRGGWLCILKICAFLLFFLSNNLGLDLLFFLFKVHVKVFLKHKFGLVFEISDVLSQTFPSLRLIQLCVGKQAQSVPHMPHYTGSCHFGRPTDKPGLLVFLYCLVLLEVTNQAYGLLLLLLDAERRLHLVFVLRKN